MCAYMRVCVCACVRLCVCVRAHARVCVCVNMLVYVVSRDMDNNSASQRQVFMSHSQAYQSIEYSEKALGLRDYNKTAIKHA